MRAVSGNYLLFGNGFNRIYNKDFSWPNLIASTDDVQVNIPSNIAAPLPIYAQAIIASKGKMFGVRSGNNYGDYQKEIARLIEKEHLQPGKVHKLFRALAFDGFITTNYDDCFERSGGDVGNETAYSNRFSYTFKPICELENRPIFHAHGHMKWPNTLCVSFDRYYSLVARIQKELQPTTMKDQGDELGFIRDLVLGAIEPKGIWPEHFFLDDLHIVGFSLDYSEIDIWSLLSLRESLFGSSNDLKAYENTVTFYDLSFGDGDADKLRNEKHELLYRLGVRVEPVPVKDVEGVEDAYMEIYEEVKDSLNYKSE